MVKFAKPKRKKRIGKGLGSKYLQKQDNQIRKSVNAAKNAAYTDTSF